MYASFFGLAREPFSIAPDPRFLFLSEQHREALAHLLFGVGGGGGFVLLTGEIGAGKTTVCRCFLQQVPPHCSVAYLFNPQFDATELLDAVLEEFEIPPVPSGSGFKARVDALNAFLLAEHARGRAAVLAIDEAQGLSPAVLEQLRLLTNLETPERKLLQIVLIGQPELRGLLKRPELEQLAQRVIARYHLGPLDAAETAAYVRHRVLVAALPVDDGAPREASAARPRPRPPLPPLPFDDGALAEIHRRTGGVPRRINVLCDRSLLGAYARRRPRADATIVAAAAAEVFSLDAPEPAHNAGTRLRASAAGRPAPHPRTGWGAWSWGAAGLGLLAVAGGSVWVLQSQSGPASKAVAVTAAPATVSAAAPATVPATVPAAAVPDAVASAAPSSSVPAEVTSIGEAKGLAALAWSDESRALAVHAAWHRGARAVADLTPGATAAGPGCSPEGVPACSRGRQGLAGAMQVDRAVLLSLRAADGSAAWLMLVGLAPGRVDLVGPDDGGAGVRALQTTPEVLAGLWQGEYLYRWLPPAGWREADARAAEPGPAWAPWLDRQLASHVQAPPGSGWRERVLAFQLAQGLPADGLPGPVTLMRLQRLAGGDATPGLAAAPGHPLRR
jgi:general secretion pathway protein A